MNMRDNKGFTLVELMIVLSIIAILAVVLIPRVGNMRDSAREQGVHANVNSVRAYLEFTSNDRLTNVADEVTRLETAMLDEFSYTADGPTGNAIINPFTDGYEIDTTWAAASLDSTLNSVVIFSDNETTSGASDDDAYNTNTRNNSKGKVMIVCCADGYLIYGYDSEGQPTPYQIVR